MRVLLSKIQFPSFICFCKPSPHIYAAGSLNLENTSQVSSSTTAVDHVDGFLDDDREEDCGVMEKKEEEEGHSNVEILKSSLKKAVLDSANGGRREKKKVQWVDLMGKELAEIREFEPSKEEKDMRYGDDQSCVCVIM